MILYKIRSLQTDTDKDRVSDILANGRLFCAKWGTLNDPFEGRFLSISQWPGFARRIVSRGDVEDMYDPEDVVPRVCSLSASLV